uniref:Zinc finger protein n=2 Tax=Globodera pallida TaxID=36090 RepID=A0A183CCN5_GLOPA
MFTRLVTVILLIALISQVVVAGPVHPEYADYFDDTMKACCAECKATTAKFVVEELQQHSYTQATARGYALAASDRSTELFIDTMSHQPLSPRDDHLSSSSHAFRTLPTLVESAKLIRTRFHPNLQRQQHEHCLLYARDKRNSTSSSDSGLPHSAGPFPLSPSIRGTRLGPCSPVASSFSSGGTLPLPTAPGSAFFLSPPWLSTLHIADSAFDSATTTPSYGSASVPPSTISNCALVRVTAGGSRFRFDNLLPPPPTHATTRTTATEETTAAEPPFATHSLLPLAPSSLQLLGGPALSSSSASASSATVLAPSTSGMATQQKSVTTTVRKKLQQILELRAIKKMSVLSHAEVIVTTPPSIGAKKCYPKQRQDGHGAEAKGDEQRRQRQERECDDEWKEEDKRFICSICKMNFGRLDMLCRHRLCHTGEKLFGCNLCGHFFSRADNLRMHKLTHSNEKPYQCAVCPYAARRRDVLTHHLSKRHEIKAGHSFFLIKKLDPSAVTAGKGQNSSSVAAGTFSRSATAKYCIKDRIRHLLRVHLLAKGAEQRYAPYDACSPPPGGSQAIQHGVKDKPLQPLDDVDISKSNRIKAPLPPAMLPKLAAVKSPKIPSNKTPRTSATPQKKHLYTPRNNFEAEIIETRDTLVKQQKMKSANPTKVIKNQQEGSFLDLENIPNLDEVGHLKDKCGHFYLSELKLFKMKNKNGRLNSFYVLPKPVSGGATSKVFHASPIDAVDMDGKQITNCVAIKSVMLNFTKAPQEVIEGFEKEEQFLMMFRGKPSVTHIVHLHDMIKDYEKNRLIIILELGKHDLMKRLQLMRNQWKLYWGSTKTSIDVQIKKLLRQISTKADIWAVGVMLAEFLLMTPNFPEIDPIVIKRSSEANNIYNAVLAINHSHYTISPTGNASRKQSAEYLAKMHDFYPQFYAIIKAYFTAS